MRPVPWVPLLGVAALAAALRWFRIDAQSLWYDEGISAHQLTRSFPEILSAAALDTLRKVKGVEQRPDFRDVMKKLRNSTNPRMKLIATNVVEGKSLADALHEVQPGSVLDFRYFVAKIEPGDMRDGDSHYCVAMIWAALATAMWRPVCVP